MMKDAILGFPQQLSYRPKLERAEKLNTWQKIVVLGMGGSHLAADLLQAEHPELPITIHSDYGLPFIDPKIAQETLVIASSYSGNTEETIDGLKQALNQGLTCAVISVGGMLEQLATEHQLPFIKLPNTGIQPRSALGFSLQALASLLHLEQVQKLLTEAANKLDLLTLEQQAKRIAEQLKNKTPIIYATTPNRAIAYNWKIKFNETAKIPSFMNVVPELHHNEMTGFDLPATSRHLNQPFIVILLEDANDHPRNQKRMRILTSLYENRGLNVIHVPLNGQNRWHTTLSSLLLADWIAVKLADMYGHESEQVPMVEDFKKQMADANA
jgi:glucose/mannose-6-phosphate isomerase